jgi:uncharacterized Zn finger protein
MERVCRAEDGLFPSPDEIELRCSCPDWADMCKHVAAALYGVGARLDAKPDLLFELRGVDRSQLISGAGKDLPLTQRPVAEERLLAEDDVAALFGIEMDAAPAPARIATKAMGSPAQREHPLKEAPTAKRAAKANAASASDRKHAEAATGSAVAPEMERRTGATKRAPSTQPASKVAAAVAQPITTPSRAKAGRRVPILTVRTPRRKRPKPG